jgi:predicted transcriptional regulator
MNTLGEALKREREIAGLTLRALGEAAGLNHSYLSRLEKGDIQPRKKNVIKIADALAKRSIEGLKAKETYRERLLVAAGLSEISPDVDTEIKERFAALLRKKGFTAYQIEQALNKVTTISMQRVLAKKERLQSLPIKEITEDVLERHRGEQIVVLSESGHRFKAGKRGEIRVDGDVSSTQHSQLETIAKLIGQVLESD